MKEYKSNAATGVEMLQIAFVVLKLCGVISWSWWWVLSPIWIVAAMIVVTVLVAYIKYRIEKKRFGI